MLTTYHATLRNGTIDWGPNGAPALPPDAAVPVQITVLQSKEELDKMTVGELLRELSRLGTFSEITDPVEWQREIRKDRVLTGREE